MDNEFEKQDGNYCNFSILLELSASNDLIGFKRAIEEDGHDVDEQGLWYGQIIGSKKMGFEERTPLMIAALYGSTDVLSYILESGRVDVNRACGSDGATALHCAFAGGSTTFSEVIKLLLDASANLNSVDAHGNHPGDLIAPIDKMGFVSRRKALDGGSGSSEESGTITDWINNEKQEHPEILTPRVSKRGTEKKEYPVDHTLPNIKTGIYGTDEFRMYTFKVKPCSRAYSHDWTECPFVHPGENARRRDPKKCHYSCVPCPEFRKGSCRQGDACEYAHGIFECWLHPAQYRTRLCKDGSNCTRRVCFFAHKAEELRPLYASTGSAVPSPKSYSANDSTLDMGSISPLVLGSPSVLILSNTSTPPKTPSGSSSPVNGWQNPSNCVTPTLQLPVSRLKSALCARDVDLDGELLGVENHRFRQQQFMDEISGLTSPSSWNSCFSTASPFAEYSDDQTEKLNGIEGLKLTDHEDTFGSPDPVLFGQLPRVSLDSAAPQLQSPRGIQMHQSIDHHLRSSYPTPFSPPLGIDRSSSGAAAFSSRSAAFTKRSQSFIERSTAYHHTGFSSPVSSANTMTSNLSDWGSPDGKLDWSIRGGELNKLRKSASFAFRSNGSHVAASAATSLEAVDETDVSWVQSLVKDVPPGQLNFEEQQQCHLDAGGSELLPVWLEQWRNEQQQMVS